MTGFLPILPLVCYSYLRKLLICKIYSNICSFNNSGNTSSYLVGAKRESFFVRRRKKFFSGKTRSFPFGKMSSGAGRPLFLFSPQRSSPVWCRRGWTRSGGSTRGSPGGTSGIWTEERGGESEEFSHISLSGILPLLTSLGRGTQV